MRVVAASPTSAAISASSTASIVSIVTALPAPPGGDWRRLAERPTASREPLADLLGGLREAGANSIEQRRHDSVTGGVVFDALRPQHEIADRGGGRRSAGQHLGHLSSDRKFDAVPFAQRQRG